MLSPSPPPPPYLSLSLSLTTAYCIQCFGIYFPRCVYLTLCADFLIDTYAHTSLRSITPNCEKTFQLVCSAQLMTGNGAANVAPCQLWLWLIAWQTIKRHSWIKKTIWTVAAQQLMTRYVRWVKAWSGCKTQRNERLQPPRVRACLKFQT